MILVLGGAFQGKKIFAESLAEDEQKENRIDGMNCEKDEIFSAGMILHFHEFIRRFMEDEEFLDSLPDKLAFENPKIIIVTNELGYGVVPVDRFDRAYREKTGRICTRIASESKEVYRVVCGIGTKIKG